MVPQYFVQNKCERENKIITLDWTGYILGLKANLTDYIASSIASLLGTYMLHMDVERLIHESVSFVGRGNQ